MFFKRLTSVFLVIALIATPFLSSASLQSDIDEMFRKFGFQSNTTAPGAYMGQTMGYLTPGALNIRATTNTIKPFTITPPRFKAGCGGIDMFFGGISFINKEQFIALAKQIGQNAIGYAFHLALNAICTSCESMLQNLQNFIQKLNKLQTDTCTAAETLVHWGASAMGLDTQMKCAQFRVYEKGDDPDTAWKTCTGSPGSFLNELWADFTSNPGNNTKATVPSVVPGNAAAQGLARTNELDTEQKEIAMSLVGTYVRCANNNGVDNNAKWVAPTLKFKDFWLGNDNAEVYTWNSNLQDCNVTKRTQNISGFRKKVIDAITRIAQARLTGSQLSTNDQEFINASTVPIIPLLDEARNQPAVVNATVELLADVVAVDMAYATIDKYVRAMEMAIGHQNVVDPKEFREAVASVKTDLMLEVANAAKVFEVRVNAVNITKLFIDQLKKSNLGPIASKIK